MPRIWESISCRGILHTNGCRSFAWNCLCTKKMEKLPVSEYSLIGLNPIRLVAGESVLMNSLPPQPLILHLFATPSEQEYTLNRSPPCDTDTTNIKQLLNTVATEVLPTLISEFTDQETVLFRREKTRTR